MMPLHCGLLLSIVLGLGADNVVHLRRPAGGPVREPHYRSGEPYYALFAVGRTGKLRIWAVLDKSVSTSKTYDVLYWDRNANGDLTEAGERLVADREGVFRIGTVGEPHTRQRHTELQLQVLEPDWVYVQFRYQGGPLAVVGLSGPGERLSFHRSAGQAPVVPIGGPLLLRLVSPGVMAPGEELTLEAAVGSEGVGQGTFATLTHAFLPEAIHPVATVRFELRVTEESSRNHLVRVPLSLRC